MSKLKSSEYQDAYGAIIEDIRMKEYSVLYYPIFLFRRLLYSICLVFLYDYPNIQMIVIINCLLFPVILTITV